MTKPVTYEATRRCVTCYGILQRNHSVLWATYITNGYIHVPDCRDFGQFPTLARQSDVSDVRNDVRPEFSVLGWRRIGHVPGRVITDCRGRKAARVGFYSNPRAVRIK